MELRFRSEAQWQDYVAGRARDMGWIVHFVPDRLYRRGFVSGIALDLGNKGYPDLTLVRGKRLLFRELKIGRNKLFPEQEEWRNRLLAAGADWALWKPKDEQDILADLEREEVP